MGQGRIHFGEEGRQREQSLQNSNRTRTWEIPAEFFSLKRKLIIISFYFLVKKRKHQYLSKFHFSPQLNFDSLIDTYLCTYLKSMLIIYCATHTKHMLVLILVKYTYTRITCVTIYSQRSTYHVLLFEFVPTVFSSYDTYYKSIFYLIYISCFPLISYVCLNTNNGY